MAKHSNPKSTSVSKPRYSASIFSRKRDLLYFLYFTIHIPVMFLVDLTSLYPSATKPQFLLDIRAFYIDKYADRFFTAPPAWFGTYMWMEALYHVPLSFWAIRALIHDDPLVPLHLLVYAVQTAVTTMTCVAEYLSWEGYSVEQKWALGQLYVPYLAASVFMGVDMFGRIWERLMPV